MNKRKGKKELARLPVQQLAVLAVCRFAEPIASTSVLPYLVRSSSYSLPVPLHLAYISTPKPEMIESFNVDKVNVAKWAGIVHAVFSLSQCLTAITWGRASDRLGRKPILLIGLTITMCTSLLWGLSTSLPMALVVRALSGAGNGNLGIIRTTVAEMVSENKELQPRAFSIMPLVWSLGSIFGPTIGGFLAQPAEQFPNIFGYNALFMRFPFLLPNLVIAALFLGGIIIGLLYLKETLETKKYRADLGLQIGRKLINCIHRTSRRTFWHTPDHEDGDGASAPLLRPASSGSDARTWSLNITATIDEELPKTVLPPPSMKEIFTRQSCFVLAAYTFLAMHSVAFDQVLPIFMHLDPQVPDKHNTHLPFKFSGGFGLDSSRIGTLFTLYGIVGGFVQFVIFPPVAYRFGILRCFKVCSLVFPFISLAVPYTALIQDSTSQQLALFMLMTVKSVSVIFAFPCLTILLTNSVPSLRVLGTLNGFATSISAVGRAAGPALTGACFSWGVKHGYMITPWWMLSLLAAVGAIPIFCLEETEGVSPTTHGGDDEDDDGGDIYH